MRPFKPLAFVPLALALLAAVLPAAAFAGAIELRPNVTVSGSTVTLGDLFAEAGPAAGVVVARVALGQTAVLDATQVQILARSNGVDWGNLAGLRRIIVQSSASAPEAPRSAEARRAAHGAAVLVYLHSLNAGDIVQADDLTWSHDAVAASDSPRNPDAVIGKAARRPLREGDPVSVRDLAAPLVIKKDDVISVTFTQAGLSLTLQAKAMSNAAAGETVSVVNPGSKRIILAVATGPGQAVVGPQADQIKAARLSNPSLLALR